MNITNQPVMSKLKVLSTLLSRPKEVITAGYSELMRRERQPNFEQRLKDKFGRTQLPTIDLLDLVPNLDDALPVYSFMPDTSLITDIMLLRSLSKRFDNCAYFEIGSYRGESIVAMSEMTNDCTSLTLSGQEMKDMGFSEDAIKIQGVFSDGVKNIKAYLHNSLTFDYSQLNKKFDLIFVDGDHEHDSVVIDTKNVFKLLKDENSIIVWHDYAFDPEHVRHEVLSAILEGTPKEYHNNLYHVSNTMCAVFIRGKFDTTMTRRFQYPNKYFKVAVKAVPLGK